MNHVKFAPRVLAMGLLAASALSIPAFAAPADGSSTAIRVDRDPAPNSASQSVSDNDSPVPVDPSQATGEIEVVYQDANGKEHSATISAVAAQAENYACINAGGDPLRVRQGPGTNYGILCSVYDGDRSPSPARPTVGTRFSAMGAPAMFRPSLWLSRTTTRLPSPMATGVTSLPTRWDRKS